MKIYFILFSFCILFSDCKQIKRSEQELFTWPNKANIYEIIPGQYPSNGGFRAITKHRNNLRKLFINTIALLPITPLQQNLEPYSTSSPYKVTDFKTVSAKLGTENDLKTLIDSFHAINIKVLLEFDFSLTALDHPWRKEKPNYYKEKSIASNENLPIDYLKLDLTNIDVKKELISVCNHWLSNYNIDGMMIRGLQNAPDDLTKNIYKEIVINQKGIFISDAKEKDFAEFKTPCGILNTDLLSMLIRSYKDTFKVSDFYAELYKTKNLPSNLYYVNYSHDVNTEMNIASMQNVFDYNNKLMAALSHFFNGVPMIFNAQECPLFEKIDFKQQTPLNLHYNYHGDFYRALILHRFYNEALQVKSGASITKIIDNDCVIGFKRTFNNQFTIILANLCPTVQNYTVNEDIMFVNELLSHAKLNFEKGKEIPMQPYQFLILTNKY